MPPPSKDKLTELQTIISKMSLDACCHIILPDMGLQLKDVMKAVRKARLPMTAGSVARVLRTHVAKTFTPEQLNNIVSQLKLKFVVMSGEREWHTIKLSDPVYEEEPVVTWSRKLASRVLAAARASQRGQTTDVEVNSTQIGDFVYLSVSRVSQRRVGAPLYVCACAGQRVAFVTSLASTGLIRAAVRGIGYKSYEDAALFGRDLHSLLRVIDRSWNVPVTQLTRVPEYDPKPVITATGIDYTNKTYDENYVDGLIGPDPPLLTNLEIKSEKQFFDPEKVDKSISVFLTLKSDDVAKTLRHWVRIKAIRPTSDFIQIFHQIKSNRITYERDDDE